MSYVAGIDYSTRAVDVVLLDEDTLHATWRRYELTGHDAFERVRSVRGRMPGPLEWDDVLAVGIEEPRGRNAGVIYRIQGAILTCFPPSLLVCPWIPSQWRKAVGLPGNASKGEVAGWVMRQPGVRWDAPIPYDATDAYCVALATMLSLERQETAST